MRSLVIGFGSIGRRHCEVLEAMGHTVALVTKQKLSREYIYQDLLQACVDFGPEYVIISNETSKHLQTLIALDTSGYRGKVLVEKPVFQRVDSPKLTNILPEQIFVGYNLRFSKVLSELKSKIADLDLLACNIYCGSYLPSWRKNIDYRQSASAKRELGGGVLRDLSHELDYMNWLFGRWKRSFGVSSQVSSLEIDSDDLVMGIIETPRCMVNLTLTYFDQLGRREMIIHTNSGSIRVDLNDETINHNGELTCYREERNCSYSRMHQAVLAGDSSNATTLPEALDVCSLIEAIESSREKEEKWICNRRK